MNEPSAPSRHTTTITSDSPVRVEVHTECDGRWFKLLNWLVDGGIVAELHAAAISLLLVYSRFADHAGLSAPADADVLRLSGLSKSGFHKARAELVGHPAGLLRRAGSAWAVCPGRPFRGLQGVSTPVDKRPPPWTRQSTAVDKSSSPSLPAPHSPPALRDDDENETRRFVVAELIDAGFEEDDARQFARTKRPTLDAVRIAKTNLRHIQASPAGVKKTPQAFMVSQLMQPGGPTLFDAVEKQRVAAEQAAERRREFESQKASHEAKRAAWIAHVVARADAVMTPDQRQLITQAYPEGIAAELDLDRDFINKHGTQAGVVRLADRAMAYLSHRRSLAMKE